MLRRGFLSKGQIFVLIALCVISLLFELQKTNAAAIDDLNSQIEANKAKIKQIEQSIIEYKKKIAQKHLEAVSFSNQISILNSRVEEIKLNIEDTETIIEQIGLEIRALDSGIDKKQKDIDRKKAIVGSLIQTLNQENKKSYIEILIAYPTFSKFYNRLQYLQTIEKDLGQNLQQIKQAKADLLGKKNVKEIKKSELLSLRGTLDGQKQDLAEQMKYKQSLLAETRSSEASYNTLLSNLKKQYQSIENEIDTAEREVRRRLAEQNKLKKLTGGTGELAWPTQSHHITATFHDPDYPFRRIFEHSGIDIRNSHGSSVRAAGSGYVAVAKKCTSASCYSYIMIIHSSGISTIYGHLSKINVEVDQFVAAGDIIGYSGGTPGSVGAGPFVTGPHLHFEVRKDGIPVNPTTFLQ